MSHQNEHNSKTIICWQPNGEETLIIRNFFTVQLYHSYLRHGTWIAFQMNYIFLIHYHKVNVDDGESLKTEKER